MKKRLYIMSALIGPLIGQAAEATLPSCELREKFSIGPVSSVQDAQKLLARDERRLAYALKDVDISTFTHGSAYLKHHSGDHIPRHLKFYFKMADVKAIQPIGDANFHYTKYYFPTNEIYYQFRIPFVTEIAAEAEVVANKTADKQTVPLVWIFVSKSGHVLSFW